MTYADGTFMGLDSQEPRQRLGAFLRQQYRGEHKTKRLASDLDCTPKAAENILDDKWPCSRHWQRIVLRFGRDVLDAVFLPDIDARAAQVREELRQLEEQLAEKERLARQMGVLEGRLPADARRAENEDRAAAVSAKRARQAITS